MAAQGKWNITKFKINENLDIPVNLTYEGESVEAVATSSNSTFVPTEWKTNIGERIDTNRIRWQAKAFPDNDKFYVKNIIWQVVPEGDDSSTTVRTVTLRGSLSQVEDATEQYVTLRGSVSQNHPEDVPLSIVGQSQQIKE